MLLHWECDAATLGVFGIFISHNRSVRTAPAQPLRQLREHYGNTHHLNTPISSPPPCVGQGDDNTNYSVLLQSISMASLGYEAGSLPETSPV